MPASRVSVSRSALAVVSAAVLLAGCGGSSTASPPKTSAATSGIETKAAVEIFQAAQKTASAAKSVHVKGKAGPTVIDIQISDAGAIGTVTAAGATVSLLRVGTAYWLKAPASFWAKTGVPAAVATKLDGKYVDSSAQAASFEGLTSIKKFFSNADQGAKAVKGAISTINGVKAIELKDSDGSLLFVSVEGETLPVRLANTGANGGQLDFTDWNAAVDIKAPAPGDIIDLKSLVK